MIGAELFAALATSALFGLVGSVHCLGMCGTGYAAMRLSSQTQVINIAVGAPAPPPPFAPLIGSAAIAWNAGRLLSYSFAGAVIGALSSGVSSVWRPGQFAPLQLALFVLGNCLVVATALALLNIGGDKVLARVEQLGRPLWQWLAPTRSRLMLSAPSGRQQFALGALWAWIPCGLVYTSLIAASAIPSAHPMAGATSGALAMFAFGAGTLPAMLGLAGLIEKGAGRRFFQSIRIRRLAGVALLILAVVNLQSTSLRGNLHHLLDVCTTGGSSDAGRSP